MKLIVKSPAGEREVAVRPRADGGTSPPDSTTYEVLLDGKLVEVNVAHVGGKRVGSGLRSLLIDGLQHEISIDRRADGTYWVARRGGGETVEVVDPLTHLAQISRGGGGAQGPSQVKAYMPGRVSAVLVAEGDEVQEGQGVLVLEAMKMENEIQAEQAGTITRVHVEPGQAVEGGDLLFDLE